MNSLLTLIAGICLILGTFGSPWYSNSGENSEHYDIPLAWGDSSEYSNEVQGLDYSDEVALDGDGGDDNWQNKAIIYANKLRSEYSYPPLKLDPKLAKASQRWAEKIAKTCISDHASQPELAKDGHEYASENLAQRPYSSKSECSGAYCCSKAGAKTWYDEKDTYDCRPVTYADIQDENSENYKYYQTVGQYMNMMDKSKTTVGFGYAKGQREECKDIAFIVARFDGQNDKIFNAELKRAGDDVNQVDIAKFVPCPQQDN